MKSHFWRKPFVIAILFVLTAAGIPDQKKYPVNYFRSPVGFKILLSGSFGEIRKNHLHSGIDIRTEGVIGKPLYAVADGYVARVYVSPGGFGKALYINHPNGFTSVYSHLNAFAGTTGIWVRNQQYKKEDFDLDAPVDKDLIKVKKGDIIAYAGNSGSSGGPHLHFEIRDTETQETINPALFGIQIADGIPPSITGIRIYPKSNNSMVNFKTSPATLTPELIGGAYSTKEKDTVKVSGNIIFGIKTHDFVNGNGLKTGINSIELWVDTALVYSHKIDRFAFSQTRYVNSLIDYPEMMNHNNKYQLSYVVPSNKLSIYGKLKNGGVVHFSDQKAHKVRYIVKDIAGNKAEIIFWVKSHLPVSKSIKEHYGPSGTLFSSSLPNNFETEGIKLELPANALYEDLNFIYSTSPRIAKTYSPVHQLHSEQVPLHTFCDLTITPSGIPVALTGKAVIVKVDEKGKYSTKGGKFENGKIKAQIRDFGKYSVMLDTTPPVIIPANISPAKKISSQKTIILKISDNLSGIRFYRGTLNGKWILMDYDAKKALLTYVVDDRLKPGKNTFSLTVRDAVGNESVYKADLIH